MPGASNINGNPWQKLRKFRKSQLFTEFFPILLNNLKFCSGQKIIFLFKYSFIGHFFRPLSYAAGAVALLAPRPWLGLKRNLI